MAAGGKRGYLLVAAIDFGTTYSGYAYQFKSDYDSDRTRIYANENWEGDQQLSKKTMTCILFNEEKEFHSFGYLAMNTYLKLLRKNEHKSFYFFKHFKMMLHEKKITREITIEAENGKTMKAMTVFAESIRYMKKLLLKQLEDQNTLVKDDRIHWVLTVPAIWSDPAKQFMRESAEMAGIDGGQLTIALEPEAASLYCQVDNEEQVAKKQATKDWNISETGQKFMLIDIGGGTVDITVQRREENGGTTELHPPSGGYFGGTRVDREFVNLLMKLLGAPVYIKFKNEHPYSCMNMMTDFERMKRTFNSSTDELTVTVSYKMAEYYKQENKEDISEAIKQSPHCNTVEWDGDKLTLNAAKMKAIFKLCAGQLVKYIKDIMRKDEVHGTNVFLMVGGFSESHIMQSAIKEHFPDIKVIIPKETILAVVKGAVLYGHIPKSVSSRMAKYTYGINISPPFDPKCHPATHRVTVANDDRCRDVFKIYIRKGDLVQTGDPKTGKHISLKIGQTVMELKVFVSEKPNPRFVDEEGCSPAGKLLVPLPQLNKRIKVEVRMMFGDTELNVEAEELENNTKSKAYFDFL